MNPSALANEEHIRLESLKVLSRYDSATVANVIELLKFRPNTAGYMNGTIRAQYPQLAPVSGYAVTATFRSAYPSGESAAYRKLTEFLELIQKLPGPRIVVIQDLDEPPAAAALGELMCRAFKRFGCTGIITNGATRDVLQVEKLHFPVFASSVIVSHGYPHFEEVQVPVHFGGLTVRPGDLLHADANGVVLVPAGIEEIVSRACGELCSIEARVIDYLDQEHATAKEFSSVWDRFKQELGELSKQMLRETEANGNSL